MCARVCIPTRDRPGNISLAIMGVALHLYPDDELFLYDDGDRPATSDYGVRFALDIATQRGVKVTIVRGKPHGIAKARAKILSDAMSDGVRYLRMVDDDIVIPQWAWINVWNVLGSNADAQFVVPTIRLANNEAGIEKFGQVAESTSVHDAQFVIGGRGVAKLHGGAWTCDVAFDLSRFDVSAAISRLENGPPVVEDYVLTAPLTGYVTYDSEVWHCMSPDQGERAWNGAALAYLRKSLSVSEA